MAHITIINHTNLAFKLNRTKYGPMINSKIITHTQQNYNFKQIRNYLVLKYGIRI